MPPRIGGVAGAGNMPERIIVACRNSGRNPYVIGLEDQADPASFSHPPDAWIRLRQAGKGESGSSSPPAPDSSSSASKNPNDAQCATMQAGTSPLIFLVAGEPSGDEIGGRLMSALRTVAGEGVRFAGIGGKAMTARGLRTLFPIEELSVMGLVEVLLRTFSIMRRMSETAGAIRRLCLPMRS